jgi:hypothetical protein
MGNDEVPVIVVHRITAAESLSGGNEVGVTVRLDGDQELTFAFLTEHLEGSIPFLSQAVARAQLEAGMEASRAYTRATEASVEWTQDGPVQLNFALMGNASFRVELDRSGARALLDALRIALNESPKTPDWAR